MTSRARDGRPPLYTDEQIRHVLDTLADRGVTPEPTAVRELLVQKFNISPGINILSLKDAVERCKAQRRAALHHARVAALPEAVRLEAAQEVAKLEDVVLGILGASYAALTRDASRREERLVAEARQLVSRCEDLERQKLAAEQQVADRDAELVSLRAERADLMARLAAADDQLRLAQSSEEAEDRILKLVQRAVGTMALTAATEAGVQETGTRVTV